VQAAIVRVATEIGIVANGTWEPAARHRCYTADQGRTFY
jgi:hypothetical protein